VEFGLGHPLDLEIFDSLARSQAEVWKTQDELDAQLDAGTLNPNDYFMHFNIQSRIFIERSRSLLGEERCDAIFGEAGRHPDVLGDRDTFLAQAKRNLKRK
jgi:hypothetical protein